MGTSDRWFGRRTPSRGTEYRGTPHGGRRTLIVGVTALAVLVPVLGLLARAQHNVAALPINSDVWTQLSPTGGPPPPRGDGSNRALGYDVLNNRFIFFGGYTTGGTLLNDTWVLAGADGTSGTPQWVQLSTTNTPAPHRHHAGAYDAVHNRLIVYGGCLGQCTPLDPNVYVLSDANGIGMGIGPASGSGTSPTWTQLSPTGGPPANRDGHTAVYDSTSNRLIVFGGDDGFGGRYNDTWVLTNANGLGGTPAWTQLSPSGGPPPARVAHSAVYDPTTNSMIIFGGDGTGSTILNDVWVLSNANGLGGTPTWTQLSPSGTSPSPRAAQAAVYDQASNQMLIFGGADSTGFLGGVRVLSNANGLGGTPA